MHTVLVCQWYPPEPIEIPRNIALSLASRGHEVSILTGVPNYPTGRVVDGYSTLEVRTDQMDGLAVHRTPLYPSHDSNPVKRMVNYASWAISASVLGQRSLRVADAALVYSSPATAALPAMIARTIWGTPYVLMVQDVWPDTIFASGFLPGAAGRVIHHLVDRFVRQAYKQAGHIAVISPGMARLLTERGVPAEKISVVYNWVPEESDQEPPQEPTVSLAERVGVSRDTRLFLYAGNHGHAQALHDVVGAFLDERTSPAHLVMLGDGVAKKQLVAMAGGHPRIHFLEPVGRAEAAHLLSSADVSVVSLADEPLFAVTMPSKVQSGLATARPMLVVARGDAASVVLKARTGAAASPGNVSEIIDAVRSLVDATPAELAAMGARGHTVYRSQMASEVGARRLSQLLTRAALQRTKLKRCARPTYSERELA